MGDVGCDGADVDNMIHYLQDQDEKEEEVQYAAPDRWTNLTIIVMMMMMMDDDDDDDDDAWHDDDTKPIESPYFSCSAQPRSKEGYCIRFRIFRPYSS